MDCIHALIYAVSRVKASIGVLYGTAAEVTDDNEKIHALELLCRRHTPANMHMFDAAVERSLSRTGVWKIEISSITGKRKKYDKDGVEMKYGRME